MNMLQFYFDKILEVMIILIDSYKHVDNGRALVIGSV